MSLITESQVNETAETLNDGYVQSFDDDFGSESVRGGFSFPDLNILLSRTGEGAIEDYIDHPLNWDNEKSTARIIRGCTGICGELNRALIDIAFGIIEKIQEKKEKKVNENVDRPQEQSYLY